jgi:hypothetical protein
MARIIVRNTAISGSIPTSLVQGELSLNVTDGNLYYGSSSRNIVKELLPSNGARNGTQYYTPVYSSANTIATSSIFQSGSFTSIRNATTPEDPTNPDILYVNGDGVTTRNLISAHGDIDDYVQINVENYSTGALASSDIVATNDLGNYIDLGINSSGFNNPAFVGAAGDAYMYSTGENLYIGNATTDRELIIFNGGSNAQDNARMWVHNQGTVVIGGTGSYATNNPPALQINPLPGTNTYNIIQARGNVDDYAQIGAINLNSGSTASTDIVAYNSSAGEVQLTGFIDMGINSPFYSDPIDFPGWTASDSYVYTDSPRMLIGTYGGQSTNHINFFVGGIDVNADSKLKLYSSSLHQLTGSLNATNGFIGNLIGTASQALTASFVNPLTQSFHLSGSFNLRGNTIHTGSVFHSGSKSLNGIFVQTGSLFITGSTTQIGTNNLLGNTTLSGSIIISGSTTTPATPTIKVYGDMETGGVIKFTPVNKSIDTTLSGSYIYVSGSTQDLYFSQNGAGYNNVTRLRWLEGNLYTGLLNGGIIGTASSTVFTVGSGSGIIVNLNASFSTNPYPIIQYLNWNNLSASIAPLSASFDWSFVAINSASAIEVKGTPYEDGEYNTKIPLGLVLHQNRSAINGTQTFPSVAYGWKQRSFDFMKAFGPLKISGYVLSPSGSSTGSLFLAGGTSWVDGRNYTINPNNPSYIVEAVGIATSKIFRYHQSGSQWVYDTNGAVGYPVIDPTKYSNNGVLTPVPTNDFSIQRVYYFPNSATKALFVYYGNATYSTEELALAAIGTESFTEAPNTAANAIFIGYMLLRHNADFTVAASYSIYEAGMFRASGTTSGGGGGGGTTTPGGSTTQIQYNNVGTFGGVPTLTYDGTTLRATGSFTGSFTGILAGSSSYSTTASYALVAQTLLGSITSASYATTASYVNPLNQPVIITGSLIVSGSLVQGSLNTSAATATYAGIPSLDWKQRGLFDSTNNYSVDWEGRTLGDSGGNQVVNWETNELSATAGGVTVDWGNRTLKNSSISTVLDWEAGQLTGTSSYATLALTASYALSSPGGAGSPGGSNGQVQYNNAGGFGGATNTFISGGFLGFYTSSADPGNSPTASVVNYAKSLAGRIMPKFKGPSGIDSAYQPALFGNSVIMWLPGTAATLAINFGTSYTARNSGTAASQTHLALSSATDIGGLTRASFQTGTTATGASGIQTAATVAFLGNSTGRGGFFFQARFGTETVSGTYRIAMGLSANNATLAAAPSTVNNSIWLGKDEGDTTWQVITKGAGTANKINTGITETAGQVLDLYIFSAPNSQSVTFYIKNAVTGADLYVGTPITTNLPANTTFMYMQTHINSVTGTTSKLLSVNKMYLEKDF